MPMYKVKDKRAQSYIGLLAVQAPDTINDADNMYFDKDMGWMVTQPGIQPISDKPNVSDNANNQNANYNERFNSAKSTYPKATLRSKSVNRSTADNLNYKPDNDINKNNNQNLTLPDINANLKQQNKGPKGQKTTINTITTTTTTTTTKNGNKKATVLPEEAGFGKLLPTLDQIINKPNMKMTAVYHFSENVDPIETAELIDPPKPLPDEDEFGLPNMPPCECDQCQLRKQVREEKQRARMDRKRPPSKKLEDRIVEPNMLQLVPYRAEIPVEECMCPTCQERRMQAANMNCPYCNQSSNCEFCNNTCSICDAYNCSVCHPNYCNECNDNCSLCGECSECNSKVKSNHKTKAHNHHHNHNKKKANNHRDTCQFCNPAKVPKDFIAKNINSVTSKNKTFTTNTVNARLTENRNVYNSSVLRSKNGDSDEFPQISLIVNVKS